MKTENAKNPFTKEAFGKEELKISEESQSWAWRGGHNRYPRAELNSCAFWSLCAPAPSVDPLEVCISSDLPLCLNVQSKNHQWLVIRR